MKTRNSLVSNSSSSSFVVVGYKIKLSYDDVSRQLDLLAMIDPEKYKTIDRSNKDSIRDIFHDVCNSRRKDFDILLDFEDDRIFVGATLASVSSDGDSMPEKEYDLDELVKKCDFIKKLFEFQDSPKLFTGERAC